MERERDDDSQENRDRRFRGRRSRENDYSTTERLDDLRKANQFIKDLENHGPAGLVHLAALVYVTRSPIKIWNSGHSLNRIVGEENEGPPIDVEFHLQSSSRDVNNTGHWTLRGKGQPDNVKADLNSCLFSVIAAQVGRDPEELKQQTINRLKSNIRLLASHIKEISWLEEHRRIVLLIGGATYTGTSPSAAARILDNSQNAYCHKCRYPGHPRGHASHPGATGPIDSVENYSKNSRKSGFISRSDQNKAAHVTLSSQQARTAMNRLNQGSTSETVKLRPQSSSMKGKLFVDGKVDSNEKDILEFVLVLRHHEDRENDSDADVFVHTFYPKLN